MHGGDGHAGLDGTERLCGEIRRLTEELHLTHDTIMRQENDIKLLHDVVNRLMSQQVEMRRRLEGKPVPPKSVIQWRGREPAAANARRSEGAGVIPIG